jgi:hypothetical protein
MKRTTWRRIAGATGTLIVTWTIIQNETKPVDGHRFEIEGTVQHVHPTSADIAAEHITLAEGNAASAIHEGEVDEFYRGVSSENTDCSEIQPGSVLDNEGRGVPLDFLQPGDHVVAEGYLLECNNRLVFESIEVTGN